MSYTVGGYLLRPRGETMSFKMVCPKCTTTAFHIERERRYYSKADPVASLIMSCQCGMRIYGKEVEDEYERQKKEFESSNQEIRQEENRREQLAQVERKRRQQMRAAMAYRAEFEAKRKPRVEGAEKPSAIKPMGQKPTSNPTGLPMGISPHPAILPSSITTTADGLIDISQMSDDELCAWHNCTRGPSSGRAIRRKNSRHLQ